MAKGYGYVSAVALGLAVCFATGCEVNEHRHGDDKDVKIATPFGGMSVKTNEAAVEGGVGLTVYPGSVIVKKKDKDSGAADVNMSFGSFHLGVKAASYTTPDAPEKVLAFYRKDMAKYGTVIQCRGRRAVGTPDHTQDGLGCAEEGGHINVNDGSPDEELKAGSKQHQHIVSIDADGAGTKIGLVMLDLPGHLGKDDDKDSQ